MTATVFAGVWLIVTVFNAVNCLPLVNHCPEVSSIQDFDVQKIQGFWYEVMRAPFNGPLLTKCNTENYTLFSGDQMVNIAAQFIEIGSNRNLNTAGIAAVDVKMPSLWNVHFPQVEGRGFFKVLSTDYENYAVMYRCRTIEIYKIEMAWVLSRKPELNEDIRDNLLKQYQQMGGNPEEILYVDQTSCPR